MTNRLLLQKPSRETQVFAEHISIPYRFRIYQCHRAHDSSLFTSSLATSRFFAAQTQCTLRRVNINNPYITSSTPSTSEFRGSSLSTTTLCKTKNSASQISKKPAFTERLVQLTLSFHKSRTSYHVSSSHQILFTSVVDERRNGCSRFVRPSALSISLQLRVFLKK